jgi:hypothetical protein
MLVACKPNTPSSSQLSPLSSSFFLTPKFREFTEGGAKHGGCFGGLTPASILIQTNELRDHCFLYNEENCGGTPNNMGKGARVCYDNEKMRAPWWNRNEAQIKSFKCWTQ